MGSAAPVIFLGTHNPAWLARMQVPLFISRRRLEGRRSFPRAAGAWALDSGGFTELTLHGRWTLQGLARVSNVLASSDTLAWSYAARRAPPLPGCRGHINCANCPRYALRWLSAARRRAAQLPLFGLEARHG